MRQDNLTMKATCIICGFNKSDGQTKFLPLILLVLIWKNMKISKIFETIFAPLK